MQQCDDNDALDEHGAMQPVFFLIRSAFFVTYNVTTTSTNSTTN